MANPSMGHGIAERTIAGACRTDPEWVFRTEVMCSVVGRLDRRAVPSRYLGGWHGPTSCTAGHRRQGQGGH